MKFLLIIKNNTNDAGKYPETICCLLFYRWNLYKVIIQITHGLPVSMYFKWIEKQSSGIVSYRLSTFIKYYIVLIYVQLKML